MNSLHRVFISLIFTSLLHINGVKSSWEDGELNIGDRFDNDIFSTQSYNSFRLPEGTSFYGATYNNNNEEANFLVNLIVCPGGDHCNPTKESQIFLSMDLSDLSVKSAITISNVNGVLSAASSRVPYQISSYGNSLVLINDKLYLINVSNGNVLFTYDLNDDPSQIISTSNINDQNGMVYLYSYKFSMLTILNYSDLTLLDSVDLSNYSLSSTSSNDTILSPILHSTYSDILYIGGLHNGLPVLLLFNSTLRQVVSRVNIYEQPTNSTLKAMSTIFENKGDLYIVIEQEAFSVDNQYDDLSAILIRYDNKTFSKENLTFDSFRGFSGFFHGEKYLYIYTKGSQLFRIIDRNDLLTNNGVMTLTSSKPSDKSNKRYDPDIMPILGPSLLYLSDNDVIITSERHGVVYKIDLDKFCVDGGNFCYLDEFPLWAICLLISTLVCAFLGVIIFVYVKLRGRRIRKRGGNDSEIFTRDSFYKYQEIDEKEKLLDEDEVEKKELLDD